MLIITVERPSCKNMLKGLTTANLGLPNYTLTLNQHQYYIESLKQINK